MKSGIVNECPLRGAGARPGRLVGRRLERMVASWYRRGGDAPSGPLDGWLMDADGGSTRVTPLGGSVLQRVGPASE